MNPKHQVIHAAMVGQVFGQLTVVRKAETIGSRARWVCRCACGKEAVRTGKTLRDGTAKSCGHVSIEGLVGSRRARASRAQG